MNLKRLRQILKAYADDKRLRIVNILMRNKLTVNEICFILEAKQPTISKHLVRLRLLGIVIDERKGNRVFYSSNINSEQGKIIRLILDYFKDLDAFKEDRAKLSKLKKSRLRK